jgi:hypothetical protein
MPPIHLVTSVPELHTARILAAAGVPYISFLQTTPNLNEIISWIEGPEVLVQVIDLNLAIPQVNHLIIPYAWYDQFYFMEKSIWWITDDALVSKPDGMIYTDAVALPTNESASHLCFYPYRNAIQVNDNIKTWLDFNKDSELFEALFLEH